jgi:D-amino-acid dehydrogenase
MRIAVLGAGVVGVTTAWYLAEAGHEVIVVERQAGVALETSFANGGQLSVSHAEPWATPGAPLAVLKWLGREDSPLLWRLRADPDQWRWGLRFLDQCRPSRCRANTIALVRLGLHSRSCQQALRNALSLDYDSLDRGILHLYGDRREFERAVPRAELMQQYGCERLPKTAAECLALEPALRDSLIPVAGGMFTPSDGSGDAYRFTQRLAEHCAGRGVAFRYGVSVQSLSVKGDRLTGVGLASGELLTADAFVAALGSYTPMLLQSVGIRVPVYPAKGYSVTFALEEGDRAPCVSLTDDSQKIVFSRLGQRLRVAGTAEFNGYDTSLNAVRCAAITRRTRALFPGIGAGSEPVCWTGLRPATPGNVPLIGRTRYRNLYLNTGHGTLGWTLACGSGKLLADMMAGHETELDPAPYLPD